MTKPAWMTFGQKAPDADRLSSAPAFAADVQKPSATAKPYPTTSTPESYSLPGAATQVATAPGATPAAVTYGSTPPPAPATAVAAAEPGPPPVDVAKETFGTQVGPYAAQSPDLPPEVRPSAAVQPQAAGWASPGLAAVPPPAAAPPPAVATAQPVPPAAAPPQRYADARAASPEWMPSATEPLPAEGRYAASGTSRFSGGVAPTAASMAPVMPPPVAPAAAPIDQPPPAMPAANPPAAPASPVAPQRRPDPGYRPGGTTSYRSPRASLAGEPASGVQPASFAAGPTASN